MLSCKSHSFGTISSLINVGKGKDHLSNETWSNILISCKQIFDKRISSTAFSNFSMHKATPSSMHGRKLVRT
uniref:Uncharacterized protein n=1 Tax=Arundo donax TaxID=35708 RepID=A0A0A9CNE5_ARUDO